MRAILLLCLIFLFSCATKQDIQWDYVSNNPNLSDREKSAIVSSRIYVGMPADSVRASWGQPFEIIQGTAAYGNSQTWYYKYFYQYWRTKAIVFLIQDENGVYRVYDITQLAR